MGTNLKDEHSKNDKKTDSEALIPNVPENERPLKHTLSLDEELVQIIISDYIDEKI